MAGSGGVVGVGMSLGFVFEGEGSLLIVNGREFTLLLLKREGVMGWLLVMVCCYCCNE